MEQLAFRLIAAHEGDQSNTLLARELRMTLQALLEASRQADSELADLLAEYGTP